MEEEIINFRSQKFKKKKKTKEFQMIFKNISQRVSEKISTDIGDQFSKGLLRKNTKEVFSIFYRNIRITSQI